MNKKQQAHKSQIESAANDLMTDGKKLASALYENGLEKYNVAEGQIKEYSDDLLKKVQHNPLAAVLIAGGIGFILSSLLKK